MPLMGLNEAWDPNDQGKYVYCDWCLKILVYENIHTRVLKRHSMAENRCCQNINKHLFLDDLNTSKCISFI